MPELNPEDDPSLEMFRLAMVLAMVLILSLGSGIVLLVHYLNPTP